MTEHVLSLSDLVLVDGFKTAFDLEDKEAIEAILHQNGMDVSAGYRTEVKLHRNLQNKVVKCGMYIGFERLDDEWIKSGAASMEAIIASSKDDNLRFTLRKMKAQAGDQAWNG